jgi:DNA-binding protein H-NS
MAERRNESIVEWLGINSANLSGEERTNLVMEILDSLDAWELQRVKDAAEEKRIGKLEEAKNAVLEQMREELQKAGISAEEIQVTFGRRRRPRAPLPVKYRSPDGQGWSGRGFAPTWLTKLEQEGHDREEYRVEEAGQ